MKWLKALLLPIILAGCNHSENTTPTTQTRAGIYYGYYGDCGNDGNCYPKINHGNLMWVPAWGDDSTPEGRLATTNYQLNSMRQGIASGIPQAILFTNHVMFRNRQYMGTKQDIRDYLNTVRTSGLLGNVKGFYPLDEPDINLNNPTDVSQAYKDLREVMGEYPELAVAVIAVIYPAETTYPGIAYVDWVGLDDYFAKSDVLVDRYPDMLSKMSPQQRLIVVPGGSSPWMQDPAPFYNYAIQNDRVAAIVAFAYITAEAKYIGIGYNGMLPTYCKYGNLITNKNAGC
jgi:hypothetical protein